LNQICSKASKLLKNQDMTTPKWVYYRSMNWPLELKTMKTLVFGRVKRKTRVKEKFFV
jgi:hypothetical protein